MTESTGERDPREQLTIAIRQLMSVVATLDIDDETAAALASDLTETSKNLTAPPRVRFYESGDPESVAELRGNHHRDHSLFGGRHNPLAPPLRFSLGENADGLESLIGEVMLDRRYEGPPRAVHGGYVAGLFDEMLGGALRFANDFFGVTGRLTVRYRKFTPLDEPLRFSSWIESVRGRRCVARAELHTDGLRRAEATALFVKVSPESVAK